MRAADAYDEEEVENPVVNPITGANRTYADVREELKRHYNKLRVTAAIKPIFLSDFVFFHVQGKGAQLGRVAHAPFGGALHTSDTVDVTEHEHTPQPGVTGFFGTFKPLVNVHFSKDIRGSLRFIRHRDVSRKDIVVFNVQTFGTGENVRVCLSSLRELQNSLPGEHPIPARVPQSHGEEDRLRVRIQRPDAGNTSRQREPTRPAVVKSGDRVDVYWTEDPVGWYAGVVTSSKKEDGVWVSRVQYYACEQWGRTHHAWHRFDPLVPDHVTWRYSHARLMQ